MQVKPAGKGDKSSTSPPEPDAHQPTPTQYIPPPSPPIPPGGPFPLPQIPLETVWDVARIVIFVLTWYVTNDANKALVHYVDYSQMAADSNSLMGASWQGASIGLLQGMIMSVQALAIIWASPTLFLYLGPVLSAALKTPIQLVAEFRRALHPPEGDKPGKPGKPDAPNKPDKPDAPSEPDKPGAPNGKPDR